MSKKSEKFTNATIFYTNSGELMHIFCTNINFTKIYKQLNRCSWIEILDIIKYDFSSYLRPCPMSPSPAN